MAKSKHIAAALFAATLLASVATASAHSHDLALEHARTCVVCHVADTPATPAAAHTVALHDPVLRVPALRHAATAIARVTPHFAFAPRAPPFAA